MVFMNGPLIGVIAIFVMRHERLDLNWVGPRPDGRRGREGVGQINHRLPGGGPRLRHQGQLRGGRRARPWVGPRDVGMAVDQGRLAGGLHFVAERPQARGGGDAWQLPAHFPLAMRAWRCRGASRMRWKIVPCGMGPMR